MAQHDYSVANATGVNFRNDLNAALQAIATTNSGAVQPTTTFPGMLWLDMSAGGDGVIKRRNAANNAWISDVGIDQTARDAAAAAQATANAALPKAGGTMTGAIVLPNAVPTGHQAVSRTQADALYQPVLPTAIAGALLIGQAGAWSNILTPGAANTVLSVSGGVPVWQTTTQTAVPNAVVRTLSDGTIDPSFIPQVASGLKFCGTFKPIVNDEYPAAGDGGHGALGAPAIGDFWVIDGLTTGGYTYLTGSLAGVTVYNGDSIAFNGATSWYRMGTSVNLQGYLKTDGSTAMTGALNMGSNAINNVGGLSGRAGSPVLQTNFRIDATNIVISPQRGTTGADLAAMAAGQLGTDLGRAQIYVGTASVNTAMLAVPFFSATAAYAANDYALAAGNVQRAKATVSAGAFTQSQWAKVLDDMGGTMQGVLRFTAAGYPAWNNTLNGNVGYALMTQATGNESLGIYTANDSGVLGPAVFSVRRTDGLVQFSATGAATPGPLTGASLTATTGDIVATAGRLYGGALHNNAAGMAGAVNQFVGSGTYIPTVTAVANVSASTPYTCHFMRVGNVVTVSGRIDIQPTVAAATLTTFGVSLPIASNFDNFARCGGAGAHGSTGGAAACTVIADVPNKRAQIAFYATVTANTALTWTFIYLVM